MQFGILERAYKPQTCMVSQNWKYIDCYDIWEEQLNDIEPVKH